MGQKTKIDKKAYLYVTDIGIDLLGNLIGSSPSEVRPPSLQNRGSAHPRENFENQYSILVHSNAFFSLSGQ